MSALGKIWDGNWYAEREGLAINGRFYACDKCGEGFEIRFVTDARKPSDFPDEPPACPLCGAVQGASNAGEESLL